MRQLADSHYMKMALGLARRGLGTTWPNPSVGCIVVDRKGHVVGRGHTGPGGRPHGETLALSHAGRAAKGATVYITLEPCAHHGETPPCAKALIAAQVARVVVATGDPDPRVAGQGLRLLQQAGIPVDVGIGQAEADQLHHGFFLRISARRPMVTVKLATSLDGRIAAASGDSKWITGPESRARGHLLRASHDAIMVGIGTVRADDPSLDCRLPGLAHRSPVRIVVDGRLETPLDSRLVASAGAIPTWIVTHNPDGAKRAGLERAGVEIISGCCDEKGRIELPKMMTLLAEKGITRLLSEGGAQLNTSLIRASLVDRLHWFRSNAIIGGDGLAAIQSIGLNELREAPHYTLRRQGRTGKDIWQEFEIGH